MDIRGYLQVDSTGISEGIEEDSWVVKGYQKLQGIEMFTGHQRCQRQLKGLGMVCLGIRRRKLYKGI